MNAINLSGVSRGTIVRTILTVVVAVNIILGYLGMGLINVTDADLSQLVDAGIILVTIVVWAWGWWKNNSFTVNAQKADEVLKSLNKGA